jgi:hypothetical protein
MELFSAFLDHTAVFTDKSYVHLLTGSALIYDDWVHSYQCHTFWQCWSLLFIWCQWRKCLLCMGRQSALQSLNGYTPNCTIIIEVLCQVSRLYNACLAMRLPMQLLKQLLCMDPWHPNELLVVMFTPSSFVLFCHRGKTSGPMYWATNCE